MAKMSYEEALDKTFKRLMAMTQEEFEAELEKHKDGPWARMLRETGADKILADEFNTRSKTDESGK